MGLAIQKSEFEKSLVSAGVDLIKKEKAGEVKWAAVTFYSKQAQRLIDRYEDLVKSVPTRVFEDQRIADEIMDEYELMRMEAEARSLLDSVKSKTDQLEAMLA